jgi:hypothetical protein
MNRSNKVNSSAIFVIFVVMSCVLLDVARC